MSDVLSLLRRGPFVSWGGWGEGKESARRAVTLIRLSSGASAEERVRCAQNILVVWASPK